MDRLLKVLMIPLSVIAFGMSVQAQEQDGAAVAQAFERAADKDVGRQLVFNSSDALWKWWEALYYEIEYPPEALHQSPIGGSPGSYVQYANRMLYHELTPKLCRGQNETWKVVFEGDVEIQEHHQTYDGRRGWITGDFYYRNRTSNLSVVLRFPVVIERSESGVSLKLGTDFSYSGKVKRTNLGDSYGAEVRRAVRRLPKFRFDLSAREATAYQRNPVQFIEGMIAAPPAC